VFSLGKKPAEMIECHCNGIVAHCETVNKIAVGFVEGHVPRFGLLYGLTWERVSQNGFLLRNP
jgi:hypothetical protein